MMSHGYRPECMCPIISFHSLVPRPLPVSFLMLHTEKGAFQRATLKKTGDEASVLTCESPCSEQRSCVRP